MCGIYALLSAKPITPQEQQLSQKTSLRGQHRGPDSSREYLDTSRSRYLHFHRLCIVDRSEKGMQPFHRDGWSAICNGELYNHQALREKYQMKNMTSDCDTEVLIPLFQASSTLVEFSQKVAELDGVFAFVIVGENKAFVARDPFGVRSLYYGTDTHGNVVFASEAKMIPEQFSVEAFPPGQVAHYEKGEHGWQETKTLKYYSLDKKLAWEKEFPLVSLDSLEWETFQNQQVAHLQKTLDQAVSKRLMSDRPIGAFLSGGLDSTVIVALLCQKFYQMNKVREQEGKPTLKLKTFSIGLANSVDLSAAQIAVNYFNERYDDLIQHHEILLSNQDMLDGLEKTIQQIESYDVTTIRASTPMFLLSQYIKKNTDITVVFSGEGSDEVAGSYLYFHHAPSVEAFYRENKRLLQDIQYFDVLRCDKTTAGAGLEVRVPFLDKQWVESYFKLPASTRMPRNPFSLHPKKKEYFEKYWLRLAFQDQIPPDIAWRVKEGMSDGVSSQQKAWFEIIQEQIGDEKTYYRSIFEKYYPNRSHIIPYQWMPKWVEEKSDPSGRKISRSHH